MADTNTQKPKVSNAEYKRRMQNKIKIDKDSCWTWIGSKRGNGYSGFWFEGKKDYGHRVSYIIHNGPIPDNCVVHHTCSNRLCVNPDHLQCVEWMQNLAEMLSRRDFLERIAKLEKEVERLKKEKNETL